MKAPIVFAIFIGVIVFLFALTLLIFYCCQNKVFYRARKLKKRHLRRSKDMNKVGPAQTGVKSHTDEDGEVIHESQHNGVGCQIRLDHI